MRVNVHFTARAAHGIEAEADLCIGAIELRTCLHETADFVGRVRERALGAQGVIQHRAQQAYTAEAAVEAAARDAVLHGKVAMFAQVCADRWRIDHDGDSQALQVHPRSNAGQLQELGRFDRTGGQDEFAGDWNGARAVAILHGNGGRTAVLKFDTQHIGAGENLKVWASQGRLQERPNGAEALSLIGGDGLITHSALP